MNHTKQNLYWFCICFITKTIVLLLEKTGLSSQAECIHVVNRPTVLKKENIAEKLIEKNQTITCYDPSINVKIYKRSYLYKYCYDGTLFDKNTGCSRERIVASPDEREMREWNRQNSCIVGRDCLYKGECWGNKAKECFDQEINILINNKTIDESQFYSDYLSFAHHTCVKSWSCTYLNLNLSYYISVQKENIEALFITPNRKLLHISLYSNQLENTYYEKDEIIKIFPPKIVNRSALVKVNCFQSEDHLMCSSKSDNEDETITENFFPKSTLKIAKRNCLFELQTNEQVINKENNKIFYNSVNRKKRQIKDEIKAEERSSIIFDAVEPVVEHIDERSNELREVSNFNFINMINHITDLKNTLSNLAFHLSIKDNDFLNDIISRDYKSYIENEELYLTNHESQIEGKLDTTKCIVVDFETLLFKKPLSSILVLSKINITEGFEIDKKNWIQMSEISNIEAERDKFKGNSENVVEINEIEKSKKTFWSHPWINTILHLNSIVGWIALILHFIRRV